MRSQLEDDQASRGEQVAQLQGQLASQEKALKEEMRLVRRSFSASPHSGILTLICALRHLQSTMELAELREKHKQITSSSEVCPALLYFWY